MSDKEKANVDKAAAASKAPKAKETPAGAAPDKKDDETVEDVYRDLIWVLLNTNEFRFVQ